MTLLSKVEYLDLSREKVNHYVPLIGNRTGAEMGDVGVKRLLQVPAAMVKELFMERKEKNGYLGMISAALWSPILFTCYNGCLLAVGPNDFAKYCDSNIFMNTRRKSRSTVLAEEDLLDAILVHELGHHLWGALGGNPNEGDDKSSRTEMMMEGFAVYCENTWFADLYPGPERFSPLSFSSKPLYVVGEMRMKRFVETFGEEIMLEVPTRWREIDKQTPILREERLASTRAQLVEFKGTIDGVVGRWGR